MKIQFYNVVETGSLTFGYMEDRGAWLENATKAAHLFTHHKSSKTVFFFVSPEHIVAQYMSDGSHNGDKNGA